MIIIADIHLGKVNDSIFTKDGELSQTADIRKRLDSIQARARLTKQAIIVAGDIFNKMNPTTQIMSVFFSWLSACNRNGIKVFLLAGNHDGGVDWTSMIMMKNVDLPNVMVVTMPGMVKVSEEKPDNLMTYNRMVFMWPHVPLSTQASAEQGHGSVSAWAASMEPDAEFIVTHGMLDLDYSNDIFFEAGNAMKIEPSAFKKLKLMVLGHIHNHTEGRLAGGGKWMYPGSLTINNFGEVDEEKGWVEVDIQTLESTWHKFPDDDVTPWVHVELDLTDKDETSLSEETIQSVATGAIVKITVLSAAHGVVNEALIRQMFNKYGWVSRFETVVTTGGAKAATENVHLSHDQLLTSYLKDLDAPKGTKALASKLGKEIITEVLS